MNLYIGIDVSKHKHDVAIMTADKKLIGTTFVIEENVRVRIKRVFIKGNYSLNRSRIVKVMKTRQARLFHAGFFKEGEL